MAENWVTITADISKVEDYKSCKQFLTSLYKEGEKCDVIGELNKLAAAQNISFCAEDFTQYEYLTAVESLKINEDKKTFKAEFNTGSGVVEFCNQLYELFTDISAKRIKIKAVDDNELEEIDWKTTDLGDLNVNAFKKPRTPIKKGGNGFFDVIAPTGDVFARICLKSGHLDGVQEILNKKDGSVAMAYGYKAGVPHGAVIVRHSDGKIAVKANYSMGLLHGEAYLHQPDGHVGINAFYKHGMLHGHQLLHRPSENEPTFEADYKDGSPEGIVKFKKPDGEIIDIEFKGGEPTSDLLPHEYVAISASENALIPHKKYMKFIDPESFYKFLKQLDLKKSKKSS